jgi:hypothetical protein
MQKTTAPSDASMTTITPTFSNIDTKLSST